MTKLIVFNQVTLDGYFTGENGDLSWAHTRGADPEWQAFVSENAQGGGLLVFGRITYEMMASYWPTPEAHRQDPVVATQMNALPKMVFSRSMEKAAWNNTRVVSGDPEVEMRQLKQSSGNNMVLMGSGTIVSQLAQAGMIDEFQLVIIPVVLGKGRTMFEGVKRRPTLRPVRTRTFKNGNVLMCYEANHQESGQRATASVDAVAGD